MFFCAWSGDTDGYRLIAQIGPGHGAQHLLLVFGRHIHEGEFIVDVDGADHAAGNAGLVGNGADDIRRSHAARSASINIQPHHAIFVGLIQWLGVHGGHQGLVTPRQPGRGRCDLCQVVIGFLSKFLHQGQVQVKVFVLNYPKDLILE